MLCSSNISGGGGGGGGVTLDPKIKLPPCQHTCSATHKNKNISLYNAGSRLGGGGGGGMMRWSPSPPPPEQLLSGQEDKSAVVVVDQIHAGCLSFLPAPCYSTNSFYLGPASTAVSSGGVSFTRWGRTVCPNSEGTELLYDGIVTGSGGREGGSAEYICLHRQPQFLRTASGFQERRSRIYGAELRAVDNAPAFSSIVRHNHPCAVCYTPTRNTKITIPGRTSCPPSWTREYYGYLMADYHHSIHKGKVPICVDRNSESVHGSAGFSGGSPLYFIETSCNGIPCPPYFSGAEITCTVCTK